MRGIHCIAVLTIGGLLPSPVAAADAAPLNLSRFSSARAAADMDPSAGAPKAIDGRADTSYNCWPYCVDRKEDFLWYEQHFWMPVEISALEFDWGVHPKKLGIKVSEGGGWLGAGAAEAVAGRSEPTPANDPASLNNTVTRIAWERPRRLTGLRLEMPEFVTGNSGIALKEVRALGRLGEKTSLLGLADAGAGGGEALRSLVPVDSKRSAAASSSGGGTNPASVLDGDPGTWWESQEKEPCPWIEVTLDPSREVARVEVEWSTNRHATRFGLLLEAPDGSLQVATRDRFCTSFDFKVPLALKRLRLVALEHKGGLGLNDIVLLGPRPGAVPAAAAAALPLSAWPECAVLRVSRRMGGPDPASPFRGSDALRIALCRNEYEPGQIVLRNPGPSPAGDLVVRIGDLAGDRGAVLPACDVAWNPVGYVNYAYADVLLPPEPFRVPAGCVRPVWITVHAVPDQPPGAYRGTIEVLRGGRLALTVPLEVEVWPVTLPKETPLRTLYYGIWGVSRHLGAALADPASRARLVEETARDYIRHRIAPSNMFVYDEVAAEAEAGGFASQVREWDRWMQRWIDAGLPFASGPPPFKPGLAGGPATEEAHWAFWGRHLEEKGWIDRVAVAVCDEPDHDATRRPEILQKIELMRKAAPKLRPLSAFSSFPGLDTNWIGRLRAWGLHPRVYGDDGIGQLVKFARDREAAGEQVAWYAHTFIQMNYPVYATRMYGWILSKYGIRGSMLYSIAAWDSTATDFWEDEYAIETDFGTAGTLVWPGRDRVLDSVRWEALRDAIEDCTLRKVLADAAAAKPDDRWAAEARKALDDTDGIFRVFQDEAPAKKFGWRQMSGTGPYFCTNGDAKALYAARERIARLAAKLGGR